MYELSGWTDTLIFYFIRTLILVLFLLTLRGLLKQVSSRNRVFRPNLVWLNLIPIFDYAWIFVTLVKVRDSVRNEYRERDWAHKPDTSFRVGLISAICYVALEAIGLVWLFAPSYSGGWVALVAVVGIAVLVFWITYWIKISHLKRTLEHEAYIPGLGQAQEQDARVSTTTDTTECPSCGLLPMPEDEFCRACGLPVEKPEETAQDSAAAAGAASAGTPGTLDKTCPYCGEVYRQNARFCSSCGRPAP